MAFSGQIIHNPISGERIQFLRTAQDTEQLLETTAELAHEGNTLRSGMPKPLHLALFVQRFQREVRAPFPPAWLMSITMAPLRMLARLRGHAARYAPELAFAAA
jgi:hypothetical protein